MTRPRKRRDALATIAVHVVVFAGLTFWSWRKWNDPLIDFGRELYLAWQISEGRVLYRDIESLFGPLSPYTNALWFRLFGDSLTTIIACNLLILAAIIAGVHRIVRTSTDLTTATIASLTAITLFGFSQYVAVGNYNFITPYAHEATHGLALGVAMILCLHKAVATGRISWWVSAGLCCGGVLLTKPEVGAAAILATVTAMVACCALPAAKPSLGPAILGFSGAALMPGLLFVVYFATVLPPMDAVAAVGRAWTATIGTNVTANRFYVTGMGLDAPVARIVHIMASFAAVLAYVLIGVAASWWSNRIPGRPSVLGPALPFVMTVLVLFIMPWGAFSAALPLLSLTGAVVAALNFWRRRDNPQRAVAALPFLLWSVFALVLLAKIGLNPRLGHYGFYLALPATVVTVILGCWVVPQALGRWASSGAQRSFRQIAVGALAVMAAVHLAISQEWYRDKTIEVAAGPDRFLASSGPELWQGEAARDALREIARIGGGKDFSLAVLPEGVMLNYLLRRPSPLRIVTAMPPEVLVFGEDALLQSLALSPPDFVALVSKDTTEYGVEPFGTEARYGRRTIEWIRARYTSVTVVGRQQPGTGIEILQRHVTAPESRAPSRRPLAETGPANASRSSIGPT